MPEIAALATEKSLGLEENVSTNCHYLRPGVLELILEPKTKSNLC